MKTGQKLKKNELLRYRLAKALKTRGSSYTQLALDVGTSENNIYSYLRGSSEPGALLLTKMSWYLNVSANYLLGLEDADIKLTRPPEEHLYSQIVDADGNAVGQLVPYVRKWEEVQAEKLLQEQST